MLHYTKQVINISGELYIVCHQYIIFADRQIDIDEQPAESEEDWSLNKYIIKECQKQKVSIQMYQTLFTPNTAHALYKISYILY